MNRPELVAVLSNPKSTHADNLSGDLERLRRAPHLQDSEVAAYDTSPHLEENIELLREVTTTDTVLVARGGDGTIGNLASAARVLDHELPVVVLPRGRINDIAHQLNGKRLFDNPAALMQEGSLGSFYPFEVTLDDDEKRDVWAYFSIGMSALAAITYNDKGYRANRLHHVPGGTSVMEAAVAMRALFSSHRMLFSTLDEDKNISELIITNGAQMGGKFKMSADLLTPEPHLITAANKLGAIKTMGALLVGRAPETPLKENPFEFIISSRDRLYFQIDGEDLQRRGAVTVSVSVPTNPTTVFADREAA